MLNGLFVSPTDLSVVVSRSARVETDLLVFLVTLAFLLTEATRGRPASGSFSVLLSSKLARLAIERVVLLARAPRPRPARFLAACDWSILILSCDWSLLTMGVPSIRLVSVLESSASRVLLVSLGDGGLTVVESSLFWSSLLVSLYSAITFQIEMNLDFGPKTVEIHVNKAYLFVGQLGSIHFSLVLSNLLVKFLLKSLELLL